MNLMPNFNWGNLISERAAEHLVPGLPEHQPDERRVGQLDEGRQGAHTLKAGFYLNHSYKAQNTGAGGGRLAGVPGHRQFRAGRQQPDRHGFRLRQRAARGLLDLPAVVAVRRGQLPLQQHRVVPPGQLAREQPAHARLRPAVRQPAAAVRPVSAGVELVPRHGAGWIGGLDAATRRSSTRRAARWRPVRARPPTVRR